MPAALIGAPEALDELRTCSNSNVYRTGTSS